MKSSINPSIPATVKKKHFRLPDFDGDTFEPEAMLFQIQDTCTQPVLIFKNYFHITINSQNIIAETSLSLNPIAVITNNPQ